MNERSNFIGHYEKAVAARPQGIVFRWGWQSARFSPYMWLVYADYEAARQIKLDFGHYDVVIRAHVADALNATFEQITRHECSELSEKEGVLSIEIIEKEEEANT